MIDDFKKIVKLGIETKDVSVFGQHSCRLCEKYGISERTLYTRFKSMFGMSPREYIENEIYPTKEEMIRFVLTSESSNEVREKTGLSSRKFTGIYDKYFECSTFQKARVKILANKQPVKYKPTIEDNYALVASQVLGDGSYDAKRHSIRIQHGIKQAEYLKWKVSLFNKAFPKTPCEVVIRDHAQGHQYADWYSRHLGNVDIPHTEPWLLVEKLTPFGWLLWYLDDGNKAKSLVISIYEPYIAQAAIKELETYDIKARYDHDGMKLIMCGEENSVWFYKNFLEPFIKVIPSCVKYKVEDIVGSE